MPYSGGSMSQWSPPFIGGTHGQELHHWRNVRVAMEPAVYRREHRVRPAWRRDPEHHVAMEPAVYRREHFQHASAVLNRIYWSQWSPPFIGGSTMSKRWIRCVYCGSQWSPPFIGGSTGSPQDQGCTRKERRNGARRL